MSSSNQDESDIELELSHGGHTELQYAVWNNDHDRMIELLNRGANPGAKDVVAGDLALHFVQCSKCVSILVSHGADINCTNNYNWTPLHSAARNKTVKIVDELLKHGADVNAVNMSNQTPLHFAVQFGNMDIVLLLISKGANCELQDCTGARPIDLCDPDDHEIKEILLGGVCTKGAN